MIYDEINARYKEMSTMGNILQLNVEDLLAFIQIKSGKFSKEIQHFNVKQAVEEINMIHRRQAGQKNVKITPEFYGFKNHYVIETDQKRFK